MIKKLDVFLSWFLKEGLSIIIFSAILLVIFYALYNVFNNVNV